jgi:hypothetical protein
MIQSSKSFKARTGGLPTQKYREAQMKHAFSSKNIQQAEIDHNRSPAKELKDILSDNRKCQRTARAAGNADASYLSYRTDK